MPLKPTRASRPPKTPVLVYDAGCPFCTACAHWLQRHARHPVRLIPFEEVAGAGLLTQLSAREIEAAAHFVTPGGIEYHGGEAVTRSLRLLLFGGVAGLFDLPGAMYLREWGYAVVARMRPALSRFVGN